MSKSNWQSDDHAQQVHSLECTAHDPCESNAAELKTTMGIEKKGDEWVLRVRITKDNLPYIDIASFIEIDDLKELGRKIMEL